MTGRGILLVGLLRGAERRLPRLADIPIPHNCKIDRRWPPLMEEMADHIGPYATVQIAEAFGGRDVYVPVQLSCSPFRAVVGFEAAKIIAHVYGREKLPIPLMKDAIQHIRRCVLVRMVRAGRLTIVAAAQIAEMNRRHMSTMVNSDVYVEDYPLIDLPEPQEVRLARAIIAIVRTAVEEIGRLSPATKPLLDGILPLELLREPAQFMATDDAAETPPCAPVDADNEPFDPA